jgi:AcrR family transcriptional regulator
MARDESVRRYRGSSGEERRQERRQRLIDAAVRVYGEQGFRNATVKAVCADAGLTERYFYESFPNQEALLVATYEAVCEFLTAQFEEVGRAVAGSPDDKVRAILTSYFESLKNDPASARVFLVEVRGVSPELDRVFARSLDGYADMLARVLSAEDAHPLLKIGAVGAVIQVALRWIESGYQEPVETAVEAALRHCLTLK